MEVMPLRYGCELGTVDGKAHHGCHETGKKERGKGMQSMNQKRKDPVDRWKKTESRQADYRDQNAIFNTGRPAPFLRRGQGEGGTAPPSTLQGSARSMQHPSPLQ